MCSSDLYSLYRVIGGSDAIVVELSNTAHLIPATSSGVTIPANYQGLFAIPIEVDGTLEILGVLVEV